MADSDKPGPMPIDDKKSLTFHYVKSNHFRVVHADGGIISVGPKGLFFSLYSERLPIPQAQTFNIDGYKLGSERSEERVVRGGVVRGSLPSVL